MFPRPVTPLASLNINDNSSKGHYHSFTRDGNILQQDLPTIHRVVFLTWSAAGLSMMTSAACLRDLEALCSPSAAITLALAFLAASASAAMALCSCSGTLVWLLFQIYKPIKCHQQYLTSLTSTRSTMTPQGSVPSSKTDWEEEKVK